MTHDTFKFSANIYNSLKWKNHAMIPSDVKNEDWINQYIFTIN